VLEARVSVQSRLVGWAERQVRRAVRQVVADIDAWMKANQRLPLKIGGARAKAPLYGKLVLTRPNLLLMDEPTNHRAYGECVRSQGIEA